METDFGKRASDLRFESKKQGFGHKMQIREAVLGRECVCALGAGVGNYQSPKESVGHILWLK